MIYLVILMSIIQIIILTNVYAIARHLVIMSGFMQDCTRCRFQYALNIESLKQKMKKKGKKK